MLRFKEDVRIEVWSAPLEAMITSLVLWSLTRKLDVVVNSIADSAPGRVATSLHPFSLAVDAEPLGNADADRRALAEFLRRHLGDHFDVVLESSHVHAEWDMRRAPLQEIHG